MFVSLSGRRTDREDGEIPQEKTGSERQQPQLSPNALIELAAPIGLVGALTLDGGPNELTDPWPC
jgi:hypothetical protein